MFTIRSRSVRPSCPSNTIFQNQFSAEEPALALGDTTTTATTFTFGARVACLEPVWCGFLALSSDWSSQQAGWGLFLLVGARQNIKDKHESKSVLSDWGTVNREKRGVLLTQSIIRGPRGSPQRAVKTQISITGGVDISE